MLGNKGQMAMMLGAIIGIVVAVFVATALYPTVHNAVGMCTATNSTGDCTTWQNTTALSGSESSMLDLTKIFFPLGIGLLPIGMIYIATRK